MKANISLIVINWNGEQFLERCMAALMAQTVTPLEIILVDNASSDKSVEIARLFPSVRLITLNQNIGFTGGNNLAINSSSKESHWIALLNPDAFPDPRWLEELMTATKTNQEFDIFGSKLINATEPMVLDGEGDAYHVSGLAWRMGHGEPTPNSVENVREVFSPCAAAALYRRDVLLAGSGFDEDYFCYVEDVDLGFRLRLAGYRCLYVPQSVAHHVGSGTTGGQHSDFALYYGHRNLVWTFVKNMPGILFWLLLPLHIAMNLVSIIWFASHGRGKIILKAKRDALLSLPRMWRKRQQIQKTRVASITDIWRQLDKRLIKKAVYKYI